MEMHTAILERLTTFKNVCDFQHDVYIYENSYVNNNKNLHFTIIYSLN